MFPVFSPQVGCDKSKDGGLLRKIALGHFSFNALKPKNKIIKLFDV